MSKARLVIGLVFLCACVSAQILPAAAQPSASPAKDPLNRDSPQSSIVAFLEACHANNYALAWRYIDLRNVAADQRVADGTELSRQLQSILDRDTQFDVADLSRDPAGDRTDNLPQNRDRLGIFKVGGKSEELDLERVTLRSGVSVWLVSSDSVARIPIVAQTTNNSVIERHLPLPLVNWQLIGTSLWRWIGMVLLAFALAALSKLISRFALWITQQAVKRVAPQWDLSAFETFIGPLRLLLSISLFRAGMEWFAPSALLRLYLGRVLAFLFFVTVFWLCSVIVDLIVRRLRARLQARHRAFSHSVLPLSGRAAKAVILLFTIAAILGSWGYNTTTLLAGLGIGGVAVALASQKTIENLFGSVAVISDRPVSVGDFCKFGDRIGTVEDIGLRSTRIRTLDRTVVTVPNGSFSTMTLENFNRRDKMLFHVTLNLRRDANPNQVRTVLESITKILKDHPKVESGGLPARFIGIGTYSLDLEIFVYILTVDNDEFMRLQQDLLLRIMDTVHAAGTALAIPTQASIVYPAPANGSASPQPASPAMQSRS
jgi:MscS family membrane protein